MRRFNAVFGRMAYAISIIALLILLYMGLASPDFAREYWVAYAFWFVGFFGSRIVTRHTVQITMQRLLAIVIMTGATLLFFTGLNYAYGMLQAQELMIGKKLFSFAVGVSEELFFGVFLIGFLINWVRLNPALTILISAGSHALFHIPQWGSNPMLMWLYVMSFAGARSLYVFVFPNVAFLLGSHGLWNFGASGGATVATTTPYLPVPYIGGVSKIWV